MANITRIKSTSATPNKKALEKQKKQKIEAKSAPKAEKTVEKTEKTKRTGFKKFLWIISAPLRWIAFPFKALGRYIAASWREIRQVRWPNRKYTWKMTFAVVIYVLLIGGIIALLDILFTFIFNNLIQ
jgi:preprotein translocase SecE subunit